MAEIVLNNGMIVLVDDEDFAILSEMRWYAVPRRKGWIASERSNDYFNTMHRFIMQPDDDQMVDHRNANSLDNRRQNLRNCTVGQNNKNVSRHSDKQSSRFKGVFRASYTKLTGGRFYARIQTDGKLTHLGSFNTEVMAAIAYDKAAIEQHGDFAKTNFSFSRR